MSPESSKKKLRRETKSGGALAEAGFNLTSLRNRSSTEKFSCCMTFNKKSLAFLSHSIEERADTPNLKSREHTLNNVDKEEYREMLMIGGGGACMTINVEEGSTIPPPELLKLGQ